MNSQTEWKNRSYKKVIRKLATSNRFYDRSAKTALFMPADKCLCVKEGIKSNLISDKSQCIFVEKNLTVVEKMRRTLNSRDFKKIKNKHIHNNSLSTLNLSKLKLSKLEYAFFDFNGSLTLDNALWFIKESSASLSENSNICFTFSDASRNNSLDKMLKKDVIDLARDMSIKLSINKHDRLCIVCAYVCALFADYDVEFVEIAIYRDTISMFFIRIELHKRKKINCKAIKLREAILGLANTQAMNNHGAISKEKNMSGSVTKHRSEAAKKAHETRQANALFAKRSEAAKKAHETRRKNAKFALRSKAAMKAWVTRKKAAC